MAVGSINSRFMRPRSSGREEDVKRGLTKRLEIEPSVAGARKERGIGEIGRARELEGESHFPFLAPATHATSFPPRIRTVFALIIYLPLYSYLN